MTTKEYLEIATGLDKRIASLSDRVIMLRIRAESITPSYGGVASGGSGNQGKVSSSVEAMVDFENEIRQIRDEFVKFRSRIEFEIQRIPNNIYATLLEERYIKGEQWEIITEKLAYSDVKYVREVLHSRALAEFDKITPENTRFVPFILRRDSV
ncbi:MAG: hypothetical protein GXY08_01680 [Ruminococcus sp.]|nr:hypothetical protein [Ruminococcus sp.]